MLQPWIVMFPRLGLLAAGSDMFGHANDRNRPDNLREDSDLANDLERPSRREFAARRQVGRCINRRSNHSARTRPLKLIDR